VCVPRQLTPAAPLKRSCPDLPDVQPQPLPTRAIPLTLWGDHLLPLLTCKDAARLGATCKALRDVAREHFKDLGTIRPDQLQPALTTFPRARKLTLHHVSNDPDVGALVQWLREGVRGRDLEWMMINRYLEGPCKQLAHRALQAGALPSLKSLAANLRYPTHRASPTEGLVTAMHDLQLTVDFSADDVLDMESQLAALGLVRQLPVLIKLEVTASFAEGDAPLQWPAFIPPSLKTLRVLLTQKTLQSSLLRALPGRLGASGATLDRLEVLIPRDFEVIGDGLVHVAQALRCCSPSLTVFCLKAHHHDRIRVEPDSEDSVQRLERLRVQWADVLAGVSACPELQMLLLPKIVMEPTFPPGTAFGRLTHLEISDYERKHPPDAGVVGLWELMASGGLRALAQLNLNLDGQWGGDEVRTGVAPAFEAVAGTLTHLKLSKHHGVRWLRDERDVLYELGVAVGKLRRLTDLALVLSHDGRAYHAFGRGLTASGGNLLPLLWRVHVMEDFQSNADLLASLLLPSVRVYRSHHWGGDSAALLMACALQQAGYKHAWMMSCSPTEDKATIRAVAQCRLTEGGSMGAWTSADGSFTALIDRLYLVRQPGRK
jgi:hypothetical protein